MHSIDENIQEINKSIKNKLISLNRSEADCLLVAVTKTHPAETVALALQSGIKHIGENKVQEAISKLPILHEQYQPYFHFIGHLQSNKVKALLRLKPYLIHSVDRFELAKLLNKEAEAISNSDGETYQQDILLQVNCSGEASKSGANPDTALTLAREIMQFPYLRLRGLMTVGLLSEDIEDARAGFRMLKEIFDRLRAYEDERCKMQWLSMGMTDDYPVALEEGANLVRIGSAIFGARHYGVIS